MRFQIHSLCPTAFAPLFKLTDTDLRGRKARRITVTKSPDAPCRVSLVDAAIGETVLLLNHTHLAADSPFDASHAIYVREGATAANLKPQEIPPAMKIRMLSLRAFDADGLMRDATLASGTEAAGTLNTLFDDPDITEVHIHYAAPGCYAARATRV